jgi:RNA polymerase sigma factor (sigma-70 family)
MERSLVRIARYLRQFAATVDAGRPDPVLIEQFVVFHDERAFAGLVERYGPLVMGVCRRVLRHHHDAEDAFQATFMVLARKACFIKRRDALANWLYKVAYHQSVKFRARSEKRRLVEQIFQPVKTTPTDDRNTWAELRGVLDEELSRMPEKYSVPLLLCYLTGQTRDVTAEQLGWTLGALKMRLERGRRMIRSRLARRGLTFTVVLPALLLAQRAPANSVSVVPPARVTNPLQSAAEKLPTPPGSNVGPRTTGDRESGLHARVGGHDGRRSWHGGRPARLARLKGQAGFP